MQSSTLYFDQFELDLNSYELRKSGRVIKLEKLPMELLILLAERQGQLVTREQIIQRLWGDDVFVDTRQGINTAVRKLRIALGDDSEHPRLLQTVPGRGYRLLVPVSGPDTAPSQKNSEAAVSPPVAPSLETAPANAVQARERWPVAAMVGGLFALLAIVSLVFFALGWHSTRLPSGKAWVQITNFADSATQPALSPDGHMIAFIRGPETFVTPGEIYVKILPDGEPVRLTHDGQPKMAPVFSPDGSRIAYTATDRNFGWNTWVVPVLGGEPRELLPNAAALTWVDRQHVMFSEIKTATSLMGVATATESRSGERDIYVRSHWGMTWGMAHRSWLSPDRKWVLISEMDSVGWGPCRVVPFDGSSGGEAVGPKPARCTYASWSPDGRTMYFSADAGDGYHIWRQDFPNGSPKQLTSGPTEEEGIAVSTDGRSLITCAGIRESTVWLHDSHGDRQISGEGYASVPGMGLGGGGGTHSLFSPDAKRLFYLVRREGSREFTSGELWMADLDTGKNEVVLPGILMDEFYIAPDGDRVIFRALDTQEISHVWIASLEHRTPPQQLSASPSYAISPGPGGEVYFRAREGGQEFQYGIGPNETVPRKIFAEPANGFISPQGDWSFTRDDGIIAQPTRGGLPIRICPSCEIGWGPNGKFLYVRFRDIGEQGGGKTLAFELPPGKELLALPPSGLKSAEAAKGLKVAAEIDMSGKGVFAPGPDPSIYAYTRLTVQRNLYRIPLN